MIDDGSDDDVNDLQVVAQLDFNVIGQPNGRAVLVTRRRHQLDRFKRRLVFAPAIGLFGPVAPSGSIRSSTTRPFVTPELLLPLVKRRLRNAFNDAELGDRLARGFKSVKPI
jgi:hypothetical protein